MTNITEAMEMLAPFQEPLRLHESDIKTVVQRFSYLKQKLGSNGLKGYPDSKLLLTSVYCYVRDPANGRKIISLAQFVDLCDTLKLQYSSKVFWKYAQFYFENGYYRQAPISKVLVYLEAAWYDISNDLSIGEGEKRHLVTLLKKMESFKLHHRAPWIVTAAAINILDKKMGRYRTQCDLSTYFGISEVSLRNAVKDFEKEL